jgi:hypothetical protein
MPINQIEQFVLRFDRRAQLFDKERYLEFGIGGIDRLDGNARSWCRDDQSTVKIA